MRALPVTGGLAALAVAAGLAGCGGSQSSAVRAKVEQFAAASATHDYLTICDDVLAPALLADMHRAGIGCVQALGISLGHVAAPRLVIGKVTVNGSGASVLTLSQARGEKTVITSLQLVETSAGWRISALGSPLQ